MVETTGYANADLLAASRRIPALPDLSVLTAEYQSAARGRLDPRWEAPARSSISVSLVLRPVNADGRRCPRTATRGCHCSPPWRCVKPCSNSGLPAELKWPNDVLVRGRKIAGILAQIGPLGGAGTPPSFSAQA